ncbi:hypothetical protein [Nocardia terpenica]|uniref:Resolvase/invertase-type recombinase catalytic domain-containing protein n=1 Tax=Nocardia terpenica TaxID=455432 RepID=A0A6G9YZC3_9NOCA|nr:hypothetical protein [Nocardia terpenica]QIS18675.1 hypothetical protein F6W96_10620 [Nocardia terpenica]
MAYTHAFESLQELAVSTKPSAIGLVRKDVSGPDAPRHAVEVQRHAHSLGYQYLYTVRPPTDSDAPIQYALGMASGLKVDVIVVYDLGHVDSRPALICDAGFDLETVCPKGTWVRSTPPNTGADGQAA